MMIKIYIWAGFIEQRDIKISCLGLCDAWGLARSTVPQPLKTSSATKQLGVSV